jgi:hypothetical protein
MTDAETVPGGDEHPEPEAVAAFADRGEAEVALAKLRAYGIEAAISDEAQGGTLPVEGDVAVRVLVRAGDAGAARELLAGDAAAVDAADDLGA